MTLPGVAGMPVFAKAPSTAHAAELLRCEVTMQVPTFTFVALSALFFLPACRCDKEPPAPKTTAASAVSSAPKPPPPPPTESADTSFETADGVPLSGTYYDAGDAAPLIVFVHRFRGDRTGWKPLLERLSKSEERFSMLNFDLRGHGRSTSASGDEQLSWSDMDEDDIPKLVTDVRAAIAHGLEKSGGKAPGVVLVGSSLGGALVAVAAGQEPKVTALAVVSPGAAIEGFDVYRPFANVRELPSFIACAKDDNVCKDPHAALGRMGKEAATVKQYDGGAHGAAALLKSTPQFGEDLEGWLMSVYDDKPRERRIRKPEDDGKRDNDKNNQKKGK